MENCQGEGRVCPNILQLGHRDNPSAELTKQLHHFVCHLNGFEGYSDINRVRFEMFKGGKFDEQLLPPNEDSLDQHFSRANFQCYIWRRSTQPILNLPSFCNHGWKIGTEGNVLINWMTLPATPDSILEFINCKCKKGCETRKCSCVKSSMKCSNLRACTTACENKSEDGGMAMENDSDDCYDDEYCSSEDDD